MLIKTCDDFHQMEMNVVERRLEDRREGGDTSRHVTSKFDADADADFSDEYNLREHLLKKECFLSGIARITSPPPLPLFRATCTSFSAVKKEYIKCIF